MHDKAEIPDVLEKIERARSTPPKIREDKITLAHGSGGKATHTLIEALFVEAFDNPVLAPLADYASLSVNGQRLAFTTDSFVVTPIFFPGGDIGELAVNGTVNDLAMSGAKPLYISAAFILEEGFPMEDLRRIVHSMQKAAEAAGVTIVTGDTKVVHKGAADGLFINTTGIGLVPEGLDISSQKITPGDKIVVNGPIGNHGMAILLARGELELETEIQSDSAPLNALVEHMLDFAEHIHVLRDATRGGVATVLNELARATNLCFLLDEEAVPVDDQVKGACELLGLDPLYVANEGKLVAVVDGGSAEALVEHMRKHPLGKATRIIGDVRSEPQNIVALKTAFGGTRIVDMLVGDQLPRIC